jgi:hypothetical protein
MPRGFSSCISSWNIGGLRPHMPKMECFSVAAHASGMKSKNIAITSFSIRVYTPDCRHDSSFFFFFFLVSSCKHQFSKKVRQLGVMAQQKRSQFLLL